MTRTGSYLTVQPGKEAIAACSRIMLLVSDLWFYLIHFLILRDAKNLHSKYMRHQAFEAELASNKDRLSNLQQVWQESIN